MKPTSIPWRAFATAVALCSTFHSQDPKPNILVIRGDDVGTFVMYSTDNAPHYHAWPDGGTVPFRSEKNSNWEGAYRVPCFVRWPGHIPAGTVLNGIVAHEDCLTTFAAIAGAPDIAEKLKTGVGLNGRKYRNYTDGHNQFDYITGKAKESSRREFMCVNQPSFP